MVNLCVSTIILTLELFTRYYVQVYLSDVNALSNQEVVFHHGVPKVQLS